MQRISRRRYTDDFKVQTVALAGSTGRIQAARQLGYIRQNSGQLAGCITGRAASEFALASTVIDLESERDPRWAENAKLKMERGI